MPRSRAPAPLDAGTIFDAFAPAAVLSGRVRYPVIVNLIGRAIADKRLAAGARLPTQRSLAQHLGIAIGTVTRAYSEAERLGLVVGEVGRGFYHLLDSLNPERILVAGEAVGIGRV